MTDTGTGTEAGAEANAGAGALPEGVAGSVPAGCADVVQPSDKLRDFLKGLASEQRQQMLELFAGGIELTVGAVAERLGIAPSTASQQLALLRRGGLLASRKVGKQVHYRVDTLAVEKSLTELQTYLRTCCPPT